MSFQNILKLGFIIFVCSRSGARGDLSPQKREAPESICPSGWVFFSGGCYKHKGTASTWDEAEIACIADGSHLVEINNAAENTFLANVIKNSSALSYMPAWIGLNDREINGTHIWYASGNVANYTNWNAYEPNDVTGQACVQMYSTGRWNDMRCSFKRDYICERPAEAICPTGWTFFRGGCYNFEDTSSTWDDAEIACLADGSHLVEINNAAENTFSVKLMKSVSSYIFAAWIGLDDREINGTHVWYSSGKVANYTNWDDYQPNDVTGLACVQMYQSGLWNDMRCSLTRSYICERPVKALCPPGWMFFRRDCYKCNDTSIDWDQAEETCNAYEGHLTDITSAAENAFLVKLMKSVSAYLFAVWIGLNDREINGTHAWVSSGKVATFTNWADYQPNDVTGLACVQMYKSGLWNDMRCSFSRDFICERPVKETCEEGWTFFNRRCFIYIEKLASWESAQTACGEIGGGLAEITSAAVNAFLVNLRKETDIHGATAWIGLNRADDTYIWYPSENVATYLNWASGEPNNYQSSEKCVEMYGSGKWNDHSCTNTRKYFCEKPSIVIPY